VPYATNADLPETVRRVLPAAAQAVFRNVWNSTFSDTESEERSFRAAWSTLRRQGWEPDEDGMWHKVEKRVAFQIAKHDRREGRVFGWAYQCRKGGAEVVDHSGEVIPPEELEPAVYDFMLESGLGSDMHEEEQVGVGGAIESMFYTPEKWRALGVPDDLAATLPTGWWVGFQYDPEGEAFANVERGDRLMFSIGGGYEEAEE
jgi:cation transport regulator